MVSYLGESPELERRVGEVCNLDGLLDHRRQMAIVLGLVRRFLYFHVADDVDYGI